MRIWDAASGACRRTLQGHAAPVVAVAFSPDCAALATGGEDAICLVWDAERGGCTQELGGHAAALTALAYSADGALLVTASRDGTVQLHDAATGRSLRVLAGRKAAQRHPTALAMRPDGHIIAAGYSGGAGVRLWDAGTGATVRKLKGIAGDVTAIAYSADGAALAAAGDGGDLRLYAPATGAFVAVARGDAAAAAAVTSLAFSPTDGALAAGDAGGGLAVYGARGQARCVLAGHADGAVTCVAFGIDGRTLASGGADAAVRTWDAATGECVRTTQAGGPVSAVAFGRRDGILQFQ